MLRDETIPYQEKIRRVYSALVERFNLKTAASRLSVFVCIICILSVLSTTNFSSYFIVMENLIASIKKGKISKALACAIIRKLAHLKLKIDPQLVEAAR